MGASDEEKVSARSDSRGGSILRLGIIAGASSPPAKAALGTARRKEPKWDELASNPGSTADERAMAAT
jgi:hypothetical protein